MNFTSTSFLFLFLPIFLMIYFILPTNGLKNVFILLGSLYFYSTGEPLFVYVMIFSIVLNYLIAKKMNRSKNELYKRLLLILSIVFNLFLLGAFKYLDFMIDTLNSIFSLHIQHLNLPLPIGISFFTFQAMSYVFDVYYDDGKDDSNRVEGNLLTFALYISMFPQLVAGPIVRYSDIAKEIGQRKFDIDKVNEGIRRFIYGLSKKMLLANSMSIVVDKVYSIDAVQAGYLFLILGAFSYTLQLYFDFSGYSDMAVGIGKMLGFTFPENFNSPYMATSYTDFWRRWHMTLSSWFKDYVYIPMGGSELGSLRTLLNLFLVWFLTGLWHGANWTFIVWGLLSFVFLAWERGLRIRYGKGIEDLFPIALCRFYTISIFAFVLIFFRSESIGAAVYYIINMLDFTNVGEIPNQARFYLREFWIFYLISIFYCADGFKKWERYLSDKGGIAKTLYFILDSVALIGLLLLCSLYIIKGSYNPFIYFNF